MSFESREPFSQTFRVGARTTGPEVSLRRQSTRFFRLSTKAQLRIADERLRLIGNVLEKSTLRPSPPKGHIMKRPVPEAFFPSSSHHLFVAVGSVLPKAAFSTCAAAVLLVLLGLCTGCIQPHQHFQVPLACLQFTADSFTGPCNQRDDGKIVCEKVVVTATCLQAGKAR
jgi:hypothetical protein